MRGRGVDWRLTLGHFAFFAHIGVRHVVHRHLRLTFVQRVFLGLLGVGVGVFTAVVILLTAAFRIVLILGAGLIVLIRVFHIRVIAQLIAVAEILNHLARKPGKFHLIAQGFIQVFQRLTGALFHEAAPQLHDIVRPLG